MSHPRTNKFRTSLRGLMSAAIRISESELNAITSAAAVHNRTVSDQAEHWIRLGRAVEGVPGFDADDVNQAKKH